MLWANDKGDDIATPCCPDDRAVHRTGRHGRRDRPERGILICRPAPRAIKLRIVTLALLRSWLFAAVPALLALCAIVSVATWHAADLHDDRPVATMALKRGTPPADDAATMVHVAAHAIGHGMAVPRATLALPLVAEPRQPWLRVIATLPPGLTPLSPIRPPRA